MEDNILCGPSQKIPNADKSLGEMYFSHLSELQRDTRTILVDDDTKTSYSLAQVYEKSVRTAACLYELGVRPNDVIGIVAVNCVDYIWTIVGCFYLGATVHPLNPDYVKREMSLAFEISKPKFVIVDTDKLESVFEATSHLEEVPKLVTFNDVRDNKDDLGILQRKLHVLKGNSSHIALILCSSGTTGLPKAVALSGEAIKNCLHNLRPYLTDGDLNQDSMLALLPFYHIFGLLTTVGCIHYCTKVVVLRKFKPDIFVKALELHQITKLFLVPPIALFLAQTPLEFNASRLKNVFCGAAPLPREVQLVLEARLGLKIRQVYGMTEACAVVMGARDGGPHGSSGKLLPNLKGKIIDLDTREPLGPNQRGEICILSPCAMKCYLNNEKATKETFDEQGFLHTGDIGYYDNEGYFYIVDRLKELIKYKGFQVPPAELEDIPLAHDEIKDAAVIGVKDERAGEKAKAYVVKAKDSGLTEEAVQAYIAKQVSNAKWLHGGVEFIDAIPKSSSGKILRKDLKLLVE